MPSNSQHLISISTSPEARARRGAGETKGRAQQVIDGLGQRCLLLGKQRESTPKCRLGCEPPRRRGGKCSACRVEQEFELDAEIARLIDTATFKRTGVCPYRVVASHLVAGLSMGPEFFRARRADRFGVDPVAEIKAARRHIGYILSAGPTAEHIEAIAARGNDPWWQALQEILIAERALSKAGELFKAQTPATPSRSPRGRTGELRTQAIAHALAGAWRELTGHLPAKDNKSFHELLGSAMSTIFGYPSKEPNLESATRTAVERIKSDAASRR